MALVIGGAFWIATGRCVIEKCGPRRRPSRVRCSPSYPGREPFVIAFRSSLPLFIQSAFVLVSLFEAPSAVAQATAPPVPPTRMARPPARQVRSPPLSEAPTPPPGPPPETQVETSAVKVAVLGYVEAYYAYNLNRPSNGITNFRGYDNRHNTFSLSNAALGANFEAGPVGGRLVLQIGSTPSTYYLGEPTLPGASGANASQADLWKYLQEAFVTYKAPVGRGLFLQMGLSASPIGYEVIAVKDNWNWSRSNLFFALPAYHAGLRAAYVLTDSVSATVGVFNGWNSIVDNNEEKSLQASLAYKVKDRFFLQALYFGGVERPTGSPERAPWRHHFDGVGQYDATKWLSLAGQADYGWESTPIGKVDWIAGALYARVMPMERVYIAVRGDRFHERLATGNGGSSAPLFWGGLGWVWSGTVTIDARPHEQLSIRLEYRHDAANAPLYFRGSVEGNGVLTPYIANATTQDTVLLGATAWF